MGKRLECDSCGEQDFIPVFYLERNDDGEVEQTHNCAYKCAWCGAVTTFYTET